MRERGKEGEGRREKGEAAGELTPDYSRINLSA